MPQPSAKTRTFRIRFIIEGIPYAVQPVPCDPSIGRKAFRIQRLAVNCPAYHVHLSPHGPQCECWGFLRYQHCKHVRCLQAAGMLD